MADGVKTSCSFSVSFDNTKLEYAGKTSGDMGASLLIASTADINTAGKVQPIVSFEDGGATSGTIVSFKFNIKTGAAAGATPLTIGDLTSAPATPALTGTSGSVTINPALCTGPTITVGTDNACHQGDTVEIPVTIDDIAGQPDVSFSVSFDKTKLQYTGTDDGTMSATIIAQKVDETNTAGKAQLIARFATGGATSGTIVKLKFTALADLTTDLPLTIGDIIPSDAFCGEDGAVDSCPALCTVTIDPQTATIFEGGQRTFTATTTGTECATPVYSWSITTSIGSTITADGVYTAGSISSGTSAVDTVTATDSANGNIKGDAVVTVINIPENCIVAISPAEPSTVECGNTIQFAATSTGTACDTPIVYEWNVTSSIGSTITETGLYKAGENNQEPCNPKTDIVRVTDTVNGGSAFAMVTVNTCYPCQPLCLDLTTVEPAESAQGQTLKVVLTAPENAFKDIPKDEITVDFGSGITMNKIKDKDKDFLKVEITIDANAIVGTRTVLVTTPVECYEGTFGVTLAPTIFITPFSGRAGETIENVTITGQRTHFEKGETKVKFGKNIEVKKRSINDASSISLKIKIGKKAVVGIRTVTVTTNLGNDYKEVVTGTFVVLPAPVE
jgi:hypothetical protein